MADYVVPLAAVRKNDQALAGGKGSNLGELLAHGFPVPPGFVVTAPACQEFFQRLGVPEALAGLEERIRDPEPWLALRQRINEAEVPEDLEAQIIEAHDRLAQERNGTMVLAVRSSATAEDLGDASFAGQHETYYYVQRPDLTAMIRKCWSSLYSHEAVQYRANQGIAQTGVWMAVVVQEMILSEISGVTFTAHPVTGNREEIVTEASWGMGAAIVDGRVTPDHFVLERPALALKEQRIGEKRFMVPAQPNPETAGRLQPVPHALRLQSTLTLEQARNVAALALRAEAHFGEPQDVEWAMANGRLYLLQSRPITTLDADPIGRGVRGKWVIFKPAMENFTDPLTPLTQDLMMLEAPPGVRFIRGWLYTQLRPWQIILPFRAPDHVLARLFTELGAKTPDLPLNYWKVPFTLAVFFMLWAVSAVLFQRTENMPDDFMDIYRDLCRRVARDPRSGPAATLRRLWSWSFRRFFEPVGQMAVLVNLSSGRYMFGRVVLQKLLARWAPNLGGEAVALLCSGTQGVLSAEMGKDIRRLAALARSREGVRILFETHGLNSLAPALEAAPEAAGFLKELGRFLDQYGHRALKELELRSIRWEEDSTPVLGMIRNYVLWQVDSGRPEEEIQRTRKKLEADLFAALDEHPLEKTFGIRRRAVSALARWIRYYTKLRENSRFYHVMGLGVVRKKVLAIEKGLLDRGRLKCKDDIFFLHLDEIRRLQQGEWGWRDVEERIRERRMEHIRLAKTTPPRTIGIDLPEPAGPGPASDGRIIRGQGASPGRYEGVAHVILDPSLDLALKPGEVLVAPYTDPAWTPLFLTAGAAVVEVGSYLSHAGTVAREFGMPCVVDAVDSTKRIRTGQRLVVNGDQGWVQLVDPENGGPA